MRPKSFSRIKGSFETWTRLGLFTEKNSVPPRRRARSNMSLALLDAQTTQSRTAAREPCCSLCFDYK
jgi:hypothetical protein